MPKNKLVAWISAARLRTLPLSVSGIIVGTAIAVGQQAYNGTIFGLALVTTVLFQVLSNFANDYGDGVKGTDNENRIGPERALQSGAISPKQMLKGIVVTAILSLGSAISLIYFSFGSDNLFYTFFFLMLGVVAIAAAMKYTMGDSAYGYRGLGDLFVFVFFGLVSVFGSYFLFTKQFDWMVLFLASAIGFLSAAVLNLNNMRDRVSDQVSGKNTLVVKLGAHKAKTYHYFLIVAAMLLVVYYVAVQYQKPSDLMVVIAFVPMVFHIKKVVANKEPKLLDPELKKLALSTFLLALLFFISQLI